MKLDRGEIRSHTQTPFYSVAVVTANIDSRAHPHLRCPDFPQVPVPVLCRKILVSLVIYYLQTAQEDPQSWPRWSAIHVTAEANCERLVMALVLVPGQRALFHARFQGPA